MPDEPRGHGGLKTPEWRRRAIELALGGQHRKWLFAFIVGCVGIPWAAGVPVVALPFTASVLYLAGFGGYLWYKLRDERFIAVVDASLAEKRRVASGPEHTGRPPSHAATLSSLPLASQTRYLTLRQKCADMREIAGRMSGQLRSANEATDSGSIVAFDRFFDLFLKLLVSQRALDRFLKSMSGQTLELDLTGLRAQLDAARTAGDERLARSLQDNIADAEKRLAHYRQSERDAEFVAVELERLETKIETLAEMRINARDAEAMSREISAVTNGATDTETTMDRLQRLTDLMEPTAGQPAMTTTSDQEAVHAR